MTSAVESSSQQSAVSTPSDPLAEETTSGPAQSTGPGSVHSEKATEQEESRVSSREGDSVVPNLSRNLREETRNSREEARSSKMPPKKAVVGKKAAKKAEENRSAESSEEDSSQIRDSRESRKLTSKDGVETLKKMSEEQKRIEQEMLFKPKKQFAREAAVPERKSLRLQGIPSKQPSPEIKLGNRRNRLEQEEDRMSQMIVENVEKEGRVMARIAALRAVTENDEQDREDENAPSDDDIPLLEGENPREEPSSQLYQDASQEIMLPARPRSPRRSPRETPTRIMPPPVQRQREEFEQEADRKGPTKAKHTRA